MPCFRRVFNPVSVCYKARELNKICSGNLYPLFPESIMEHILLQQMKQITPPPPIPLDGDSATIRNFGQNDTNRSRNGRSAVEAQKKKRQSRSRSVLEFHILCRKDIIVQRKRSSIANVVARSQLHRHQR